ncbi:hypothetical protein R3P38DRAFT_3182805 [Favolaschia claudopus]|uniref:DUF6589 domain-containing protein n=1 Tax=Favolaschia claudopus TaxID=2862362 RepID=A0AAW0CD90_9AGAR
MRHLVAPNYFAVADTACGSCLQTQLLPHKVVMQTVADFGIKLSPIQSCRYIFMDFIELPLFLCQIYEVEYADVYEQGIGRKSELKVGTAATCVELDDVVDGAFDAEPFRRKVEARERKDLTTDDLFDDIDWVHIRVAIPPHWTLAIDNSIPKLHHYSTEISAMFRGPLAKHRMREGRKTVCHPLGTNSEKSTETLGMERAVRDFDSQMEVDSDDPKRLFWVRGDGASYANFLRLTDYGAPLGIFKNKIDYGPATSSDPSSLSRCSNMAGLKRPSNLKACDYYPTVRNLTIIWKAHVLDCWRIRFETDNLQAYFSNLARRNELPPLDNLLGHAMVLVDSYASQAAIHTSLSAARSIDPGRVNKVREGTP